MSGGQRGDEKKWAAKEHELMRKKFGFAEDEKAETKVYKEPLTQFLAGRWLEELKKQSDGNTYAKPEKWAAELKPVMATGLGPETVMRAVGEWMDSHVNNTSYLSQGSQARNFLDALHMLDRGEKNLTPSHISALKNGQQILETLMKTIEEEMVREKKQFTLPKVPDLFAGRSSVVFEGGKRKTVKFDIGVVAGKVYSEMLLPHLTQVINPITMARN